jgi:hypothetical protein
MIHDVRTETRWFTTKSRGTWHVLGAGDGALCRANIRPCGETFSDAGQRSCPVPIPRCLACVRKLATMAEPPAPAGVPVSGVYDCPCCDEPVMSSDIDTRVPCGGCLTADCQPNRDGAYDDCQRACMACGDPRSADFYVCVVIERSDGETDYSDGYVCADHGGDAVETFTPSGATVIEYAVSELQR